tara:strand:- start:17219 stop:20002 length:2784 start_codon:yes stop_codon:yes gene_type:complete
MAYEFKPYRSVYRDPQSVKVSEVLANRYTQNFASDSMLDKQLNEMLVAAEFAGDVQKANELKAKLNDSATKRNNRGDFENLGMNINMDVREFQKNYQPIKQNYDAREKDKESKRRQVESKAITNEMYDKWEKISAMNIDEETGDYVPYSGLSYGEDGTLDRGSIYQPKSIAPFVDTTARVLTALNAIEKQKGGGEVYSFPEMKSLDHDNNPDTPDRQYEFMVQRSNGMWEGIDPEQVKAVTNEVLNTPDVKAFMSQDANYNTFDLRKDELINNLTSRAEVLKGKLNSGNLTNEEKTIANSQLNAIEKALDGGDVGSQRAVARGIHYDSRVESLTNMAVSSKGGYSSWGGGSQQDYSARERFNWQLSKEAKNAATPVITPSTVLGKPETLISALADPKTNLVTLESATEAIEGAETMSQNAAGILYDELDLSSIQAFLPDYLSLPNEDVAQQTFSDIVSRMTRADIKTRLQEIAGPDQMIRTNDGGSMSVKAAMSKFESAKGTMEHYEGILDQYNSLINLSKESARTSGDFVINPEDWAGSGDWAGAEVIDSELKSLTHSSTSADIISGQGDNGLRVMEDEEALKYMAASMFRGAADGEPLKEEHDKYGNMIDHVYEALGQKLSKDKLKTVFLDAASDPNVLIHPQGSGTSIGNPDGSKSGAALAFTQKLEKGHEQFAEELKSFTTGTTSYPIQSRPTYTPKEIWNPFVDSVKQAGVDNLLDRNSLEVVDGQPNQTIRQVLESKNMTFFEEIENVSVTYHPNALTGVPEPCFLVQFKGKSGDNNQSSTVKIGGNVLAASAPGIEGGFALNTLHHQILGTALAQYNNMPGVIRKNEEAVVSWGDKDSPTHFKVTFPANVGPQVDGGPDTVDLTKGLITVIGSFNNLLFNGEFTYSEWQTFMHQVGFDMGRQGDVDAHNILSPTTTYDPV